MIKMRNQRTMVGDIHSLFHLGAMGTWADGKLVSHFISEQAGYEGAFRVLLHRHGPMVLAVCRRVLGDNHAAEDAFQATFLVLVKRAGSIRDRSVLTGWLYGVALRVSKKAKAKSDRRRVVEHRATEHRATERPGGPSDSHDRAEIRALIEEEIARLPERYREPLVLCYLEGLRHHEIAERLECPVGTVESRLSRGRQRLKSRLELRGLAPSATVPGVMLIAKDVSAAVPASLVEATIQCTSGFAFRRGLAGVASASVASLAKGSAWPQLGLSLPSLIACTTIFVAGLGTYCSWVPGARPEWNEVAAAEANPGRAPILAPTPAEAPAPVETVEPKRLTPALPPVPTRPDSAIAVPLGEIAIDARLDDWPSGLESHPIRRRLMGVSAYDSSTTGPDASPVASFRAGYSKATGRIYLAIEVEDEDLVVSTMDHLHTDAVEIYVEGLFSDRSVSEWILDAARLPVVQYVGVPGPIAAYGDPKGLNPTLISGKLANSTTEMAYHRDGNVTIYEWAVQAFDSYPDHPTRLEPGKRIGLEVVVVDKDRNRPKPTWLNWGPAYTRFKGLDAANLGELILVDGP